MRDQFPTAFVAVTGALHAAAITFAGLGEGVSPLAAEVARWLVAAIYVASVVHVAIRGGREWASRVLLAAPAALALGLVAGATTLAALWGTRTGTPLGVLAACALPAAVAALIAPALGAIARKAVVLEHNEP